MADKSFGVEELNLLGTGTPTIESPNNLNIIASNVAISTNLTIGGQINSDVIIGNYNVGIGTTIPTNAADSNNTQILNVGIVTANNFYGNFYGDGSGITGAGSVEIQKDGSIAGSATPNKTVPNALSFPNFFGILPSIETFLALSVSF